MREENKNQMIAYIISIILITAFGSFIFELSGVTVGVLDFFKLDRVKRLPVRMLYKLLTCGKCASFHTAWIYFRSTENDWPTSIALACACGILSIYICKNAYSGTIH